MTLARTLAALALAAGLLGAAAPAPHVPASGPAAPATSARKTALVLERYLTELERLPAPRYISFEYSIEQGGGTDISEVHRIYRAGRDSRDELIESQGQRLRLPRVRIRHDAADRYALSAIAPTPARYTFAFVRSAKSGDHLAYTYGTQAKSTGAFSVDEITIDGASFLPTQLRFHSSAGGVHGHGTLIYAKTDRYWLIREARADALAKDGPIGERIVWSAYRFPSALPATTFGGQAADPVPLPTAAP